MLNEFNERVFHYYIVYETSREYEMIWIVTIERGTQKYKYLFISFQKRNSSVNWRPTKMAVHINERKKRTLFGRITYTP